MFLIIAIVVAVIYAFAALFVWSLCVTAKKADQTADIQFAVLQQNAADAQDVQHNQPAHH